MTRYNILKLDFGRIHAGKDKPYRKLGEADGDSFEDALQNYYERQAEDDHQAYRKFVDNKFIVQEQETRDDTTLEVEAVNGTELMFNNG